MALRDFWISIRTAARFLSHNVITDSSDDDTQQIAAALQRASIWLTPKSVEGYDEQDFDFLTDEDRQRLSRDIHQFIAVARQVPPDKPASSEQVQAALPLFLSVFEIMRPDQYADIEAFRIGKRIEQELRDQLPDWVREMRFESGKDANGDPAIWIWVEMDDTAATKEDFSRNTRRVRSMIIDCVRRLDVPHWPYVRFSTVSERIEAAMEAVK